MNKIEEIALSRIATYIYKNYKKTDFDICLKELFTIFKECKYNIVDIDDSYESLQLFLSKVNEKSCDQKEGGVFYTPSDVANYINNIAIKLIYKSVNVKTNIVKKSKVFDFCFNKTFFDPTCGSGEFLISILSKKIEVYKTHFKKIRSSHICKIIKTIFGCDCNKTSLLITKARIFLMIINYFGINSINGLFKNLQNNFFFINFLKFNKKIKFDFIVGNPPYFEVKKSFSKYGNIFADILDHSLKFIKKNSVFGFILPLSYISTLRMSTLRNLINTKFNSKIILSFNDRPDCLFSDVHQKLCVVIYANLNEPKTLTTNFQYWYKSERPNLFKNISFITNIFENNYFIPKLGNSLDVSIYKKIISYKDKLNNYIQLNNPTQYALSLNMRAAFWIKCFIEDKKFGEYKTFYAPDKNKLNFINCILNSSLFWWYWTVVSDAWHITIQQLNNFGIPNKFNGEIKKINILSAEINEMLENTKIFVGTKQTDYVYKHKDCIQTINKIDELICKIFKLTTKETNYIKQYKKRYRLGGGQK